jgi:S1-C subfamily serine protease
MLPHEDAVVQAVQKVSPSVVNISMIRMLRRDFFSVVPVHGMGSGFIINSKGRILTDYHIVENAQRVEVSLSDGRRLPGKVSGMDRNTDLALVEVEVDNLPVVELGDSDQLKVGQLVIAIGNPFGFLLGGGPTVTLGVVSALGRHIMADGRLYEDLIQTDAAINPGNSGGPLVDLAGKVVGISTANIPFAQGIGFAIPINIAKSVADDLIVHGRVIRPWLGITGMTVTNEIARYYNLPSRKGVLVIGVIRDGPADQAGIEEGDVIIQADGSEIDGMEMLRKEIRAKSIGERIELILIRDSRRGKVEVITEEAPSQ